ncbi:MAG: hypothetical protein COW01_11040 [Bdellovibrionales bacterium CG12_big_fil_rev_8_21_14_0_65_38_15]|nr:MAG: hypothetical protein COW79_07770 [Bdellovibrionales bacterium CG22_combo_CG10-13_8_21_14_all_38_13]PIQ54340.1 MAG: hypothetical protein COW01_11040 [Bdellovibrionales bacterium CG12_big_fil_rev_8_21_14_0_65_38_15]PIR28295.1 MAG: hypothetical protein COV38_16490 [Bdellovibrionales bacterium CG11_big_fil_rev_8_21_14_0_20_38_13]
MEQQLFNFLKDLISSDDNFIRSLKPFFLTKSFKTGELFLDKAEKANLFGIVENGMFKICYLKHDGSEAIKTFRNQGELIGSYSDFLKNQESQVTVEAMKPSRVSYIPRECLNDFFNFSPNVEVIRRKIAERLYCEKENREYQFLCLNAYQRLELFMKHFSPKIFALIDNQISKYLGVTPVYLSKLRKNYSFNE